MLLWTKIHILPIHANLSLIVFRDSNWYISVVLLYVIAAGVRSNKRYSNPVAYWILAIHVSIFILHSNACDVIKIWLVLFSVRTDGNLQLNFPIFRPYKHWFSSCHHIIVQSTSTNQLNQTDSNANPNPNHPYGRKGAYAGFVGGANNCTTCKNPMLADLAVLSIYQRQ